MKAYVSDKKFRDIINSGGDLHHYPAFSFAEYRALNGWREKVPAYAKDYITRRAAILSVVRISNSVEEEQQTEKLTAHIHILIESYVEIDKLGDIIVKIMDFGDPSQFPEMKGYSESEIVKLESLIEQKDYSIEMYQNFSRLIFPIYFPLTDESN